MSLRREQALVLTGSTRGRACGLTLAIALAVGAVGAADATAGGMQTSASGPLRYVTSTADVPAANDGASIAFCTGESRLAGGGGAISGPVGDVRLGGIFPFDFLDPGFVPDDSYLAEGFNNGGSPRPIRSVAICLRNAAGGTDLSYDAGDSPPIMMGSSVGTGATAVCTSGRVVGGGFEIPGPATTQFEEQLNASRPHDADGDGVYSEGWRGTINVNMSTVARTAHAHAVCQPAGDYKVRYRSAARIVFPDSAPKVKVKCPSGKGWRVTGGGIQGFFSRIRASAPFDDNDRRKVVDDGWRAQVVTSFGADPEALVVHAICIKRA
jgi:hypothetical protein